MPPAPAPVVPHIPSKAQATIIVPPLSSLSEEDIAQHFEALCLSQETATLAQVYRAFKVFAPTFVGVAKDFDAFTVSFKLCEAALGGADTGGVGKALEAIGEGEEGEDDDEGGHCADDGYREFDACEVYHQVVHAGRKHAELKVCVSARLWCLCVALCSPVGMDRSEGKAAIEVWTPSH